uniref:NADH-ubiquinone oxidoreductase chain 2 n=1 Tax=Metacrangonyx longicaudus TaxID=1199243 RepID=K7ZW04_9CRUS|nr:NADH dehydrogenase subunit 2 [Metacrangonyx longicaudus]CCI69446.1 NADH dehydrogenase subunit 2 [Metacrangonyx longicaudus]
MFFHPSTILFFLFLIFSLIMMVSMNSWFMIWFFIEMNLLSFIPLILLKKNKYSIESSLKYFFIQTLSSILILIGLLMMFMNLEVYNYLFMSGLSIKLGLAPFHQWMVNIGESLTWSLLGMLLTIQKIGPFLLFGYILKYNYNNIYIIYLISLICMFFGSLGGLFTSSLRKIMVFSSISHSSWMILGIVMYIDLWVFYFSFYSLILFSVLVIFYKFNISNLNHMYLSLNFVISFSLGINLLSMGGMPPMSGFVPKFILMKEFFLCHNYFILFFLLMGVFISLFFYCRMFIFNFIYMMSKNLFLKSKFKEVWPSLYINSSGLILIPLMMYFY